ncbi:MAG: hypothetical protein AAB257_02405 [Nitrospinota bacterium]
MEKKILVMSKANLIIISIIGCLFLISTNVTAIEVAPRVTDREIIEGLANIRGDIKELRAEIKRADEGQKALKQQIAELKDGQKALEGRIDTLIYAVLGCFVALIGIVIWNRRTALSPAIRKNKELEERNDKIEKALKEYAYKEPRLAEILRNVGIM